MIGSIVVKARYYIACLFVIGVLSIFAQPALAAPAMTTDTGVSGNGRCVQSFLTFPAWFKGLTDANCDIKSPAEIGFTQFVTTIALNVVEMLLNLAGYASVAFIIYGGYKYMISAGSPDGMVSARKTIMNAVIGLIISIAAVAIVNTIANGLGS